MGAVGSGLHRGWQFASRHPPDIGYVTDRAQKEAQAQLAAAVAGAKHVVKTDSGHEIHKDQPRLVLDAIREVVDAVRAGKTAPEP